MIKNIKPILKAQQRFRSDKHNAFIEEINKVALSSNDKVMIKVCKEKKLNVAIQ